MTEWIVGCLILTGSIFCAAAALGVARLPDTLTRLHATTKAGTLGAGLILIACAVFYQELGVVLRAISIITLLVLTAPVAAHLIGRASYESGLALSDRTWIDELQVYEEKRRTQPDYCQPDEL